MINFKYGAAYVLPSGKTGTLCYINQQDATATLIVKGPGRTEKLMACPLRKLRTVPPMQQFEPTRRTTSKSPNGTT